MSRPTTSASGILLATMVAVYGVCLVAEPARPDPGAGVGGDGAQQVDRAPTFDRQLGRPPVLTLTVPERMARLERWKLAVDRHLLGEVAPDDNELNRWERIDVQGAVEDLGLAAAWLERRTAPRKGSTRRLPVAEQFASVLGLKDEDDTNRLLRRGVVVHTDIALRAGDRSLPVDVRTLGRDERLVVIVRDGSQVGIAVSQVHWDASRGLLASIKPDPTEDAAVLEWYLATAAFMQFHYFLGYLEPHLDAALRLFPNEGRVLFAAGALHETFASPRVQSTLATVVLPARAGRALHLQSAKAHLKRAEQFFVRALSADATLAEARLRLGRIVAQQGRHREALTLLEAAADALDDPELLYLDAMFLGEVYQALGSRDAAREAYERAARLFPAAQSPPLALASLAWRTNDRAAAMASLRSLLSLPRDQALREDPWWDYSASHVREVEGQLAEVGRTLLGSTTGVP